jgi:hypothetical protein
MQNKTGMSMAREIACEVRHDVHEYEEVFFVDVSWMRIWAMSCISTHGHTAAFAYSNHVHHASDMRWVLVFGKEDGSADDVDVSKNCMRLVDQSIFSLDVCCYYVGLQ